MRRSIRSIPALALLAVAALTAGCASRSAAGPGGGGVATRLVVDRTSAPADGTSIHAVLVVTNRTGKAITLDDACNGWVRVGLVTSRTKFDPAWTLIGCPSGHLATGVSRTSIAIHTTYDRCVSGSGADSAAPACVGAAHDESPRFRPGRYRTAVAFRGTHPRLPTPAAVDITLTAR